MKRKVKERNSTTQREAGLPCRTIVAGLQCPQQFLVWTQPTNPAPVTATEPPLQRCSRTESFPLHLSVPLILTVFDLNASPPNPWRSTLTAPGASSCIFEILRYVYILMCALLTALDSSISALQLSLADCLTARTKVLPFTDLRVLGDLMARWGCAFLTLGDGRQVIVGEFALWMANSFRLNFVCSWQVSFAMLPVFLCHHQIDYKLSEIY